MNKNTIIAIVLSTLVVIASFVLQPILFPNSYNPQQSSAAGQHEDYDASDSEGFDESGEAVKSVGISMQNAEGLETVEEELVTIQTEKAEVVLTNRGGDIISYKLKNHIDVETNEGVQMADNVSATNRACALSFGAAGAPIVNELFHVEKIDDYTYLFTKRLSVENDDGTENRFILGKKYTFLPDDYMFKLDVLIHSENEDGTICVGDAGYTLRTSPQIGPHFNPKFNRYENRQFVSFNGSKAKLQVISARQFKSYNKEYVWNGIAGKYFVELVIPEDAAEMGFTYYSTLVEVDDYANAQAILVRKPVDGQDSSDSYYLYFGPRNEKDLKIYNVAENNGWSLGGLKLTECLQSSGWLSWLETILKWIMEILYKLIPNWGVSIILMTILLKLAMFPFTKKQSMSTLKMQEMQPQVQSIQAKYKDNPQKQQEMMAKLYKDSGYNPMSGCLPLIVQFLILFAMYNLFNNYFEFRGASFIPKWIPDLSSGDSVHTFSRSIPFFGNQLRILPVVYLVSQLLYGKITGNGGTAAASSTKTQMNMMMYGMPIVFFFLFYNAPSGLLLYWTVSNLFQMVQQIIINKMMKEKRLEISSPKGRAGKNK